MKLSAAQGSTWCTRLHRRFPEEAFSLWCISAADQRWRLFTPETYMQPPQKHPVTLRLSHRWRSAAVKCNFSPASTFLHLYHSPLPAFFFSNFLPLHIYHSLYLHLPALCVCIDFCGSERSMLFALFDRGSEMESQAAEWNQSPFFSSSSLSLFPRSTETSANSISFELVCVKWALCALIVNPSLSPFSCSLTPPHSFFSLTSQILLSLTLLCYCQKLTPFPRWLSAQVC